MWNYFEDIRKMVMRLPQKSTKLFKKGWMQRWAVLCGFILLHAALTIALRVEAIMTDIRSGFQNKQAVCYIAARAQAIMHAVTAAAVDDVVLVAGKGHEQFQIIGQHKHPFCDVAQVQLALQQRGR